MIVLVLIPLQKLAQLLLSKFLESVRLALQLLFKHSDFMILLLFQFNDLKTDFVLTQFLSLHLLLALELAKEVFCGCRLVINFLISALFLDAAQVDDVGRDSRSDRHCLLEVGLHVDQLIVVVCALHFQLLSCEVFLLLLAFGPGYRELFDLRPILLVNLFSDRVVFVGQISLDALLRVLTNALHRRHVLLSAIVVTIHRVR